MLYVTSRKVLGLLSNWREPLILSYMSCEISGNVAHQDPLSMGLPRQESWSGLPFLSPGDLLDLGVKPTCFLLDRQILYR